MATFLSLPPEIKSIIVETLDLKAIKSLRLSCRLLGSFLESLILHTISFDINAQNLLSASGIPKLQQLATKKSRSASRTTKRVVIKCLSPEYDPKFETESFVNGQWVTNTPPKDTPACIVGLKQMELYLFHALSSLKNVSSVSWTINQHDEEWAQRTVAKALLSLHNLRSLRIDIDWARIPIPLHHIKNLHDITIIDSKPSSPSGSAHQTYLNLGKMLARSPQLRGIHIHRGDYDAISADISASLHQLFWCFPAAARSLRLTSLSLNKVFVKLDRQTLRHMHHLKSLDLSNMLEPCNEPTANHPYDDLPIRRNSDPQTSQTVVASSIDSIWLALGEVGVQLEEIKMNKVTSGLLNYLETYSGAKKLHLRLSQNSHNNNNAPLASSEELASQFFGSSLGNHAATLEDLQMEAADEGGWCFGENNKTAITACRKLHSLGMSISPASLKASSSLSLSPSSASASSSASLSLASIPPSGSNTGPNSYSDPKATTNSNTNIILSLLDTLSKNLPNLHTLNLTIPTSIDRFEGYWCGYSVSHQFSWACDVIAERLCTYSADESASSSWSKARECKRLPVVVIGEKTCKEKRLDAVRMVAAPAAAAPAEAEAEDTMTGKSLAESCRWVYRESS